MRQRNWIHRLAWLIVILVAVLLIAVFASVTPGGYAPALAQDAEPAGPSDDEVNAIAKQLYCPVCENIPLDVCPTQACAQWRELIRQKLSEGWNEQQIKDYFVEQYGERVLGAPPARGLNWMFYLVPPIAILAGIFILYKALQSMRARSADPAAAKLTETPTGAASDDYIKRLEEELRKKD